MLRFTPAPEHVRTARLVAVSVARRSRLGEDRLDEVRLVVGEICARAVRRAAGAGVRAPVELRMVAEPRCYRVSVVDQAGVEDDAAERVALELARVMADELEVSGGPGGAGGTVRATWILKETPLPRPSG